MRYVKVSWLVILLCFGFFAEMSAQVSLDPKVGVIHLMSDYSKFDDREDYDRTNHEIIIDFDAKKILVVEQVDGTEAYSIDFLVHHDGTSQSVILQPGENLFMVRKDSVELCSYQDMFKSFSINFMNERTHSFMGIERLNEEK